MKTIFEKIIDREIPADIVYETESSIAFLDISPVEKGHVLLITKNPYPWITDVPSDELGKIFQEAQKIINAMKTAYHCDYVQLGVVGKDVPHFHIHLIPKMLTDSDDLGFKKQTPYIDESEKNLFKEKLQKALL